MIKILILTDFTSTYSRSLLRGIVKYSQEVEELSFYRMPLFYRSAYGDKYVISWAKKWKADAIIGQLQDLNISLYSKLNIPIIIQNYYDRANNVINLTGDYIGTGYLAADFFMKRGFKNFAYYGIVETIWSRERYQGYKERVEENSLSFYEYLENERSRERRAFNLDNLAKWLKSLPKPIAIFACDDQYALYISETCKIHDISIPNEISLMGVDNDNLFCNISNPPLSSILLDVEYGGYLVAKTICQLIKGEITQPEDIFVRAIQIVKRESTEKFTIRDRYILNVVEHIEHNFKNTISVDSLLKIVPLSRRVLEKRFRQNTGSSIYNYILSLRVENICHLLINTDRSIEYIATESGFKSNQNMSKLFFQFKEMTPSEYRKNYRNNS
ncbi:MAG TPA: transcriptional regulator [Rikenellaceae bacterium]|jgi:LacI family transcriptional regulator|nr:MAG: transcriptional regulator [Bacteroidetes bacterium GWE2_40_15]HBZ26077.1 transcriptional regulator [Rikenellaceae bacterium]